MRQKQITPTDNKLINNEKIIYQGKYHWAVLLGPFLFIFFGWLMLGSRTNQAIIVLAFGLLWGVFSYIKLRNSKIILTDYNLLISIGFPFKRSYDIPLNNITFIDFYQPSLGTILNFGKLIIVQMEKKKKAFRFIDSPANLVKEIHQQVIIARDKEKKK